MFPGQENRPTNQQFLIEHAPVTSTSYNIWGGRAYIGRFEYFKGKTTYTD